MKSDFEPAVFWIYFKKMTLRKRGKHTVVEEATVRKPVAKQDITKSKLTEDIYNHKYFRKKISECKESPIVKVSDKRQRVD